jgi:uncharacterized membrane protein YeaQ/YmgE (transglycosylase-associated protein family)
MLGSIIGAIVIGLILGVLARLILPGKQNIPLWLTILVGIVAAYVGTWIARALGFAETPGFDWWEHIVQLIVALIAVGAVAGIYGKRGVRS